MQRDPEVLLFLLRWKGKKRKKEQQQQQRSFHLRVAGRRLRPAREINLCIWAELRGHSSLVVTLKM